MTSPQDPTELRMPPGKTAEQSRGSELPRGVFLANAEPANEALFAILRDKIQLHCVHSLADFRVALRDGSPDLVLTSWNFPEGTWKQVIAAVEELDSSIPVIVISTSAEESKAWYQVFCGGGFDTISPPYQPNLIAWVIQQALESRLVRRAHQKTMRA